MIFLSLYMIPYTISRIDYCLTMILLLIQLNIHVQFIRFYLYLDNIFFFTLRPYLDHNNPRDNISSTESFFSYGLLSDNHRSILLIQFNNTLSPV